MGLELAKAYVSIRGDQSNLDQDFRRAEPTVRQGIGRLGSMIGPAIGALIGAAGIAGLVSIANESVELAGRQEEAEARLAAVLKATGNAAGFTTNELKKYASELQNSSTTGDEAILESMAILATFKSVTGDVFKRASAAAIDLSATGFGSVEGATQQLAKALEDPIRGLGALRRVGVSFSAEQEKMIKKFVEMGDVASAQNIILEAVEGQVKGTAQALADTDAGKLQQLNNTLGDIKEEIGQAIVPLFVQFKEVQIAAFEVLSEGVKWLSVFASNSEATWGLFSTQALLSFSRIRDFFMNVFENLPQIAAGALEAMVVGFVGWIGLIGNGLKELLNIFTTTFKAMEEFWLNIFTGKGIGESFKGAISTIGDQIMESTANQLQRAGQLGSDVAEAYNSHAGDVDLFKASAASQALQAERDRFAGVLADARAAMDVEEQNAEELARLSAAKEPDVTTAPTEDKQKDAAFSSFASFGRQLQERALQEQTDNQQKMISLLERSNTIQEQILNKASDPVVQRLALEGPS